MQELSGNPSGNGETSQRIEAGPGMYDHGDTYSGDQDLKPWQRQPTGAAAPWQRNRNDRRDDYVPRDQGGAAPPWASGNRGGDSYGGFGGAPGNNIAPWEQPPPPPPGGQPSYGYGGYPGSGFGEHGAAYGAPPPAAPPGLSSFLQQYAGAPPPPPSGDALPPPPSGDAPPPPPPPSEYPPPPPPS